MEPRDFSKIIALENENWTVKSTPHISQVTQTSFEKKILSGTHYLLALENDEIIGALDYQRRHPNLETSKHVWTFGLIVDKNFRKRGVASSLLKKLIDVSRETNVKKITINVLGGNTEAIQLYEKIGFVREGHLKKEFFIDGHYIDDLIYAFYL